MLEIDENFYTRANAYIHLANSQCDGTVGISKVCGAFAYALARFGAWVDATNYKSGEEMKASREATIEALVAQYREMLAHHMDDHINNFERLMTPPKD